MTGQRTIPGRKAELTTLSEFGCETAGIPETQFVAPRFLRGSIFHAPEFQRPVLMCSSVELSASAILSTWTVKKANRPPALQLSTICPCSSYVS